MKYIEYTWDIAQIRDEDGVPLCKSEWAKLDENEYCICRIEGDKNINGYIYKSLIYITNLARIVAFRRGLFWSLDLYAYLQFQLSYHDINILREIGKQDAFFDGDSLLKILYIMKDSH